MSLSEQTGSLDKPSSQNSPGGRIKHCTHTLDCCWHLHCHASLLQPIQRIHLLCCCCCCCNSPFARMLGCCCHIHCRARSLHAINTYTCFIAAATTCLIMPILYTDFCGDLQKKMAFPIALYTIKGFVLGLFICPCQNRRGAWTSQAARIVLGE